MNEKKVKRDPVTANVKVKKESGFTKLKKQFFAEDSKSVGGHVVTNVIIPGIQKLLTDGIKYGIDWLVYGRAGTGQQSGGGIRNISYSNYYDKGPKVFGGSNNQQIRTPGPYSVQEIIFNDRGDAEATLARLREELDRYGSVSVADFYDLVSVKHSFTDVKYGWKTLDNSSVQRTPDGYYIRFNKIIPIE